MSFLFQDLRLRSLTIKNRIVVSPMCQYSSKDGFATDWHLVHLGTRAVGGAGIVFTEATAVSPKGRISYADLGIWQDEHIEGLERITRFLKTQGAIPAIQLAHAGRKASRMTPWEGGGPIEDSDLAWQPLGPSAIPFHANEPAPHAMDQGDIQQLKADFRLAAERALRAGFQILEIHAAHGYLLHSFLSPISNQRTDQYGGTFENRIRLLLEITKDLRSFWPADLPLFVRISADDWLPDRAAWTIEASIQLAGELKALGVDLVDTSSAGLHPEQKIKVGAGYQLSFAERIKKEAGIMTGAVGMITSAEQAETIIRSGQADLIFIAREFLRNPYFPYQAAQLLHEKDFQWPNQYVRAKLK
ncbi:MAG: NADH:flavin oxidoreductase/NADH oxidase [Saprospiraceae bacterium]|nr:NADH:flavin oxidoreductase/NADH oxidase [Saprospiraceae bacterium]